MTVLKVEKWIQIPIIFKPPLAVNTSLPMIWITGKPLIDTTLMPMYVSGFRPPSCIIELYVVFFYAMMVVLCGLRT